MIKDTDIFILCGGQGKRLRKISRNKPKCMMKMGSKVFLDVILDYMADFGFRRFILGVGYKADAIKKYYLHNKRPRLNILFSHEKIPLDTGGAVKKAKRFIKSKVFFVLNGDSFSIFNPEDFMKFHSQNKANISILLRKVKNNQGFGVVMTGRNSEIICFSEKDSRIRNDFINGGVYIFSKSIFSEMPKNAKFSLEYDFFPQMIGKRLYGYKEPGFFIDIGTPERYFAAKKYFSKKRMKGLLR